MTGQICFVMGCNICPEDTEFYVQHQQKHSCQCIYHFVETLLLQWSMNSNQVELTLSTARGPPSRERPLN